MKKSVQSTPIAIDALLALVKKSLDDDKAQDIVDIALKGKSDMADYLVVASGTSGRQVGAMAEHLRANLKDAGLTGITVEGLTQCDWVLVDGGDVVVHLFRPEVRSFYNIEKMWGGEDGADPAHMPPTTMPLDELGDFVPDEDDVD